MYATPETYLPTLVGLAKLDKAWAWKRAKELAATDPMFAEMPALLTAAMKEVAHEASRQDRREPA